MADLSVGVYAQKKIVPYTIDIFNSVNLNKYIYILYEQQN